MRRRKLLLAVGGLLAAPLAHAQQPSKTYRIGWLPGGPIPPGGDRNLEAFLGGMRELGYVEGRNLVVERRYNEENLPVDKLMAVLGEITRDLVRVPVDVIVASHTISADAAQKATGTVPIVMGAPANPVAAGLVASLARPGGNVTGLTLNTAEITAKRLQLIKDAMPGLSRVGLMFVLRGKDYPPLAEWLKDSEAAAAVLGLSTVAVDLPSDTTRWEEVFRKAAAEGLKAISVAESTVYLRNAAMIGELSVKHRLALIGFVREFAESGCLMAYGADVAALFRRAATFVDKILKGASPATLPVELPTRLTFAVNMKTARTLGLKLPQSILLRADRVIE